MDATTLSYEETTCAPKRGYAGRSYAGIERKQKNLRCGERYEKTPVLHELPLVGKKVRFLERLIDTDPQGISYRIRFKEARRECVYEVMSYTQGIENPLAQNNFLCASYMTKSGTRLAFSVRAVDIALGIIKVIEMDENEESEAADTE